MYLKKARSMLDIYCFLSAPVGLIGAIHILGGITILMTPEAAKVSQMAGVVSLLDGPFIWLDFHPYFVGMLMLVVGAMAIYSRIAQTDDNTRILLVLPQQLILVLQVIGVLSAAWQGQYPNGHIPVPGDWNASFWFIIGDQSVLIMLCWAHSIEFIWIRTYFPTLADYQEVVQNNIAMSLFISDMDKASKYNSQGTKFAELVETMEFEEYTEPS